MWGENWAALCNSKQKGRRNHEVWSHREEGPASHCSICVPIKWTLCALHTHQYLTKIVSVFAYQCILTWTGARPLFSAVVFILFIYPSKHWRCFIRLKWRQYWIFLKFYFVYYLKSFFNTCLIIFQIIDYILFRSILNLNSAIIYWFNLKHFKFLRMKTANLCQKFCKFLFVNSGVFLAPLLYH